MYTLIIVLRVAAGVKMRKMASPDPNHLVLSHNPYVTTITPSHSRVIGQNVEVFSQYHICY
jgi:hypothetical protein